MMTSNIAPAIKAMSPYVLFLVVGLLLFPSAGRDDVYISYWAAHTLSVFGEILNYNGDRIEQSSSLLHTFLLALLHGISGVRLPLLGLFVSVGAGLFTIWLSGRLALRMEFKVLTVTLLCATAVPLLYWSFGKLETTLVAAAVLLLLNAVLDLGIAATKKTFLTACVAIFIYQLLRPEAFLVTTLFLSLLALVDFRQGRNPRPMILLALVSIVLFAVIAAWRYWYFGSLFPLPVEAKVGLDILGRLLIGHDYFFNALADYPLLLPLILPLPMILYGVWRGVQDRQLTTITLFVFVYLLFIYSSGGDWMEGGRFFAPLIAPMVVLAISYYRDRLGDHRLLAAGLSLNLGFVLLFAWHGSSAIPLFAYQGDEQGGIRRADYSVTEKMNRVHYRDIRFLEDFREIVEKVVEVSRQPLILSRQAGMVPYYTFREFYGVVRFTDFLSLSTREFLDCDRIQRQDRRRHGLWINYRYYFKALWALQRQCDMRMPDIIFDIDNPELDRAHIVETYNYQVVFVQTGQVPTPGWLKGKAVQSTQFVAVRKDLIKLMQITPRRYDLETNQYYSFANLTFENDQAR